MTSRYVGTVLNESSTLISCEKIDYLFTAVVLKSKNLHSIQSRITEIQYFDSKSSYNRKLSIFVMLDVLNESCSIIH